MNLSIRSIMVSYYQVCKEVVEGKPYKLVEAVAEKIASKCFEAISSRFRSNCKGN